MINSIIHSSFLTKVAHPPLHRVLTRPVDQRSEGLPALELEPRAVGDQVLPLRRARQVFFLTFTLFSQRHTVRFEAVKHFSKLLNWDEDYRAFLYEFST